MPSVGDPGVLYRGPPRDPAGPGQGGYQPTPPATDPKTAGIVSAALTHRRISRLTGKVRLRCAALSPVYLPRFQVFSAGYKSDGPAVTSRPP